MLKIPVMAVVLILACSVAARPATIDVGALDQDKPPAAAELQEPAEDAQVPAVGQYATVTGTFSGEHERNVYVLVNPLSNPATRNVWWVQRGVRRDGDRFDCSCQFGEGWQGQGEYFAILAIATDRRYTVGQRLQGLPPELQCSQLKIVKRTR